MSALLDATTGPRSLVRLAFAGIVLPAAMAASGWALLEALSGAFHSEFTMAGTMAVFIVQIGVMSTVCAKLTDWPRLRWVIYAWCWLLIDFQVLIAWAFASQMWWGDAFQATAIFSAQLNLALIWGILGMRRWTVRLPAAAAIAVAVGLVLIRFRYWHDNAAPLFGTQIAATAIVCVYYWWRGYRLALGGRPIDEPQPAMPGVQNGQFGIRDMLFWTTCFALVCGFVRLIGLPLEAWRVDRFYIWPTLIFWGIAAGGGVVIGLWAGLAARSARWRWLLLFIGLPTLGLIAGLTNTMYRIFHDQSWNRPWAMRLPWWNWAGWLSNLYQERFTIAWICLIGGMLFATLLLPRTLGYRLMRPS